ncbi:MAG: type II toxin-antitoxin system prevent-host-death family antitoxin [bacterium]
MVAREGRTVGSYEARTHFSELIEEVEAGGEITITRHGTPVARLVPVDTEPTREVRERAIEAWRNVSEDISLGNLDLKELIQKGRS